MEFLNSEEKFKILEILAKSSQLQTSDERRNFLIFCGLEDYCGSIQLDQPPDKFVISLYSTLSKIYITLENSKKLGLVIFLEYINQLDSNLSTDDQDFIQHIITKGEQWQASKTPSKQPVPPATKRDVQNRRKLLSAVASEVANRLEQSLHNIDPINLHKQKQPQQVWRFWDADLKTGKSSVMLPSDTKILDIFDQKAIAGKLLILGVPGSGKTTALLELAEQLIPRAEQNLQFPIPVLFSLADWQDDRQTIADWLVAELENKQTVRVDIGKQWLKDGQILPLLDGLDEIEPQRHERCIQAINQFLQEYRPLHLIVSSRLAEYENCSVQLHLNEAVCIRPLTKEQIQQYLNRVGCSHFWQSLQADSNLLQLAQTPLFLNIITLVYEEISLEEWQQLDSDQCRYRHLFNAYVERMLERTLRNHSYGGKEPLPEQTKYWLKWLAEKLNQEDKTGFLVENIQPNWLENYTQKWLYYILGGLMTGLVVELTGGLIAGLMGFSLTLDLFIALFSGLIWWIGIVLIELHEKIKLEENDKWSWSWQTIKKSIIIGLGGGLIIGLGLELTRYFLNLPTPGIIIVLIYSAILGMIVGIINVIITIFLTPKPDIDVEVSKSPNQKICKAAKIATIVWIIGGSNHYDIFLAINPDAK